MARSRHVEDAFYRASARFVDDCLRSAGSLFTPGREIWSEISITDLYGRLLERGNDDRGADFLYRLRGVLDGAGDDVVQLAAEVLYVLLLSQDTRPVRKRDNILAVLDLASRPVAMPEEFSNALGHGIASYGPALSQRFSQYTFLLEFANAWTRYDDAERKAILSDPDRFHDIVFSLPRKSASVQAEALLHIVFPDDFEPIVSAEVKRKICDAFEQYSPDQSCSIDRCLAAIRKELARDYGDQFSFHDPPVRACWDRHTAEPKSTEKAWLVRATVDRGGSMLAQWLTEEFVSLGWPNSTRFDLTASEREIRRELSASIEGASPGRVRREAGAIKRFLSISAGDLILAIDADKLYVARAHAEAHWNDGEDGSCLRRPVQWLNRSSPASRTELSDSDPGLYKQLQTLSGVRELNDENQTVKRLAAGAEEQEPPDDPPSDTTQSVSILNKSMLPSVTDQLAESLYLPKSWLQEAIELLEDRRQLILYGPPGTGKTFVAQALGEHIKAAGGDWRLVQFHPAYSYEDFFEGYRPSRSENGGALQFNLRGGPLRLLAEQALSNPEKPYLLVIDEINRGNIAKIFGEFYFLLEYRDRPIRLQYSPEQPFELPKNLFLIGTMNTADRSIALVDSALRRRFYFMALLPQRSPVREVLGRWLAEKGYDDEASRLLNTLNDALRHALAEDEFAIGPSYFMAKNGPPNLERIWRHAIGPLLEERFYGVRSPDELDREFGLEAIKALLEDGDPKRATAGSDQEAGILSLV